MDPGTALLRRCLRRVAGVEREGRLAGVAKRPGSDVTAWSVLEVRLSTRPPYPSRAGAPVQFFLRPLCVDLPRPGHRGPRIPCSSPAHQLCVSSARRKRRDKACCWWCAAVDEPLLAHGLAAFLVTGAIAKSRKHAIQPPRRNHVGDPSIPPSLAGLCWTAAVFILTECFSSISSLSDPSGRRASLFSNASTWPSTSTGRRLWRTRVSTPAQRNS